MLYRIVSYYMMDRFRLYLLLYLKVGQNSISYFKGHNFDYFKITRKLK